MTVACIVTARMTSARLPGKPMMLLAGEPVIRHVLRRCKAIPGVDKVVLATPDSPRSRPLVNEAVAIGGLFLCAGSETDVLARFHAAAVAAKADYLVRVTGDCPLIDPAICGEVLSLLITTGADYASNVLPRGFPKGLDCEAFRMGALAAAHKCALTAYDREHVTPWMQRHGHRVNLDPPADWRWVLDTQEDYERLAVAFDRLPAGSTDWREVRV